VCHFSGLTKRDHHIHDFHVLPVRRLAELVVGGPVKEGLGAWGEMLVACTIVAGMFAIVRFLYNRKIFLRF
jgi:hypothetical protein